MHSHFDRIPISKLTVAGPTAFIPFDWISCVQMNLIRGKLQGFILISGKIVFDIKFCFVFGFYEKSLVQPMIEEMKF